MSDTSEGRPGSPSGQWPPPDTPLRWADHGSAAPQPEGPSDWDQPPTARRTFSKKHLIAYPVTALIALAIGSGGSADPMPVAAPAPKTITATVTDTVTETVTETVEVPGPTITETVTVAPAAPKPSPKATSRATAPAPLAPAPSSLDPRFATCKAAIAAGYGPYYVGKDPEYNWYRDADHDGKVCER